MSIGIIGLLPAQANAIEAEYTPRGYNLAFLPKQRDAQAADFAKTKAKVIVLTKFISHSTEYAIPAHKLIRIHGGMTKLRRWLNENPPVAPVVKKTPTIVIKEAPQMSTNPNKVDYTALKDAQPQDRIKFPRPPGVELAKWKAQVTTVRHYYNRQHDIETKAEFAGNHVLIIVLAVKGKRKPAPLPKITDQDVAEVRAEAAAAPPTFEMSHAEERALWSNAAVAALRAGHANPIEAADAVLAAYRKRFA